jgi:hypothetical protein
MRRVGLSALFATALAAAATAAQNIDWFSTYALLTLRVQAPFNDLFAHAQQDGYAVHGSLSYVDRGRDVRIDQVTVSVRGHTSRRESECTFPKLKVTWPSGSLKIGTHCGDSTDDGVTARFGRLPNERSPVREAFVYRLLDTLDVPALRARPARITYIYTDATPGTTGTSGASGTFSTSDARPITRLALVVEDNGDARRRLGADKEIPPEQFTSAREAFTPEDAVTLAFAEALIGNFDWCLRFFSGDAYRCDARRPLWNIRAFAWPDGRARPLMYDFDVTGMVAGRHRWFADIFNEGFLPDRSRPHIEVIAQLQRARTLFDRPVLDSARRRFAGKKADAYRLLDQTEIDASGKQTIKSYLDAFFESMESDAAFYRPVVTTKTMAYADAERTKPVCSTRGPLPVGTPVSDPVQTRGTMLQVVVLDALWRYAPPVQCPAIHKTAVWIDKSAIGTNYP